MKLPSLKEFLAVPSPLNELLDRKVLFVTIPLAVFCLLLGLFFTLFAMHRDEPKLPLPYFSTPPASFSGKARIYLPGRTSGIFVKGVTSQGREFVLPCDSLPSICEKYSPGHYLGHIEVLAHPLWGDAYWPVEIRAGKQLILTSEQSFAAYPEFRHDAIYGAFFYGLKMFAFFSLYSLIVIIRMTYKNRQN